MSDLQRRFSKRRVHSVDEDGLSFLQSFINTAVSQAVDSGIAIEIFCPQPFRLSWIGIEKEQPDEPWEGPLLPLKFTKESASKQTGTQICVSSVISVEVDLFMLFQHSLLFDSFELAQVTSISCVLCLMMN